MKPDAFLHGQVLRLRLPCLHPPTGPDAPLLKRLMLPQGELAQIRDDEDGMRYVAVMELRPNTVRGNHVHQHKVEHVYVIEGQVELWMREGDAGEAEPLVLEAGDLVVIHPGVAHALRATRPGWGIEFAPSRFDPADVRRVAVIPHSPS